MTMTTGEAREPAEKSGGSWYTWWRGDALPDLAPLADFFGERLTEPEHIAALTHVDAREARTRIEHGHRAYVAYVSGAPVGWGWSATREAAIGELGITFQLPASNHYLWSFETATAWRGRGVYPHLLQFILRREGAGAERFWIGHEPGNDASARGILKAGFERVGEIVGASDGSFWLIPGGAGEDRVRAGAAILGASVGEWMMRDTIRASYDRVASEYAETFFDELQHKPFDRELLDRFAGLVRDRGPVWDLGCGPGHVGRYLYERGIPASGFDLSERMVVAARRLNPGMSFLQGTMLALPLPDASLAGIVTFYAVIHLPREDIDRALCEFYRALQPGGHLLLAVHGGEGEIHTEEWFGKRVDVTATLFEPEELVRAARAAGFTAIELTERPPYTFEHPTRRVYLLAQKPY